MSSATQRLAVRTSSTRVGVRIGWQDHLPLIVPCGLLVVGAAIGFAFTLDAVVAAERLLGLVLVSLLALAATALLRRRTDRPEPVLLSMAVLALVTGLWVVSASGPDVFRGSVGAILQVLFRPIFGLAQVTDPVEVANTRFIVGYNGLADLCLVAIFCCGALLLERPGVRRAQLQTMAIAAVVVASLVVLVGTGARGGLSGLAAGVCAIGMFAWPRRIALLALLIAPVALVAAAVGILDKGLEFSSTAGRLTYWGDLARLLGEYPLTGVGLGVDTAFKVTLQYEINPDPERVFYVHNTFVQSYMEMGPIGTLGMLAVPAVALAAAFLARRFGVEPRRRALLIAGLGMLGALETHGLTDQVVTTNVGTGLVLIALAAVLAAQKPAALAVLRRWVSRGSLGVAALAAVVLLGALATPSGRAQILLDLGGLELNQALQPQMSGRVVALTTADSLLSMALSQSPDHPAILRGLARVHLTRFDDAGALDAVHRAAQVPRLDAFDMLQIAHLYRDLGFADEAYAWASRAYAVWGRSPEDAVMQTYAQSTLAIMDDSRARTLADQAEAAMRARTFSEAALLFQQALIFEPRSAYLQDRLGAAQRAVQKYRT